MQISITNRVIIALLLLLPAIHAKAQLDSARVMPLLKQHITTLSSDSFGGREPGTKGEILALEYITKEFQDIGLKPKGSKGYIQAFTFTRNLKAGPQCRLSIGGKNLEAGKDFYPLGYSANAKANGEAIDVGYGIIAPSLQQDDYAGKGDIKGKIAFIDISVPDHGSPHTKFSDYTDLRLRLDTAIARGAVAVIFYTRNKEQEEPALEARNRISPSSVPVLYLVHAQNTIVPSTKGVKTELESEVIKEEATGHNVLGYIDNKAEHTAIIGAHYDHLGMGGHESLYRGEAAVHNGADDNASGVAGVIELARYLKQNGPHENNYLFMAFSGEEKGLLGSGFYTKNPTIDLSKVNYMLNMDMIGRLKTDDPVLIINGAGTSDAWKITFNYIKVPGLKYKTTESGIGPSDHTSFYLKDIPVLHFFSGTHSDYHKPSDDEHLINYGGELAILNFMVQLVQRLDDKGKIAFVKTKEENNENTPRFKVTLGVIPDYGFEGQGMRIDGVTEGKPAAKAGLKAGDIVKQIGEYQVVDMMSYMRALGKFNKGEKAEVTCLRGKEIVKVEVEF